MIQHVGVGDERICFVSINRDSKDATSDHHTTLAVLLQCELRVVGHRVANCRVILVNIFDLVGNLFLKWRAIEKFSFLLRVENWEVSEALRQNVDIPQEGRVRLSLFLHQQRCQERVFR